MNIGIIGTGVHGSRYANHIVHDLEDLSLTAISRRSPAGGRQAGKWGVTWHGDWRALVDDPRVEAVIAVTPPVVNSAIAGHCLAAGKPLLVEKPLAATLTEGREMVRSFRRAGLPLTVAQTLRFNPVIRELRGLLGRLGSLYTFSASHRLEPSIHGWLEDPDLAGGGVVLHTAVHMFDALRFITGLEVVRVRASFFQVHNPRLEDLFTAQLELEKGVVGTVDASKVGKGRSGRYEFVGSAGELHADQVHGVLRFIRGATREAAIRYEPVPAIVPLLRSWSSFLRGEGENPVPGEEGLAALAVCHACGESHRRQEWQRVR